MDRDKKMVFSYPVDTNVNSNSQLKRSMVESSQITDVSVI